MKKIHIGIYKIGGGAVNSPESFSRLITQFPHLTGFGNEVGIRVYVISAFGDVTSQIEQLIELLEDKVTPKNEIEERLNILELYISNIVGRTLSSETFYQSGRQMQFFRDLVWKSHGNITPEVHASLLQFGELVCSYAVYDYMKVIQGHIGEIDYLDLREIIKTGKMKVLEANVYFEDTQKQFDDYFTSHLPSGKKDLILIAPGYIASSVASKRSSIPTVLGKEGSDYSAAILASAAIKSDIQFESVQLIFLKANPGITLNFKKDRVPTKIEEKMKWDEVETLTRKGSKILHPGVASLMKKTYIPVIVTNLESFCERIGNSPKTVITR